MAIWGLGTLGSLGNLGGGLGSALGIGGGRGASPAFASNVQSWFHRQQPQAQPEQAGQAITKMPEPMMVNPNHSPWGSQPGSPNTGINGGNMPWVTGAPQVQPAAPMADNPTAPIRMDPSVMAKWTAPDVTNWQPGMPAPEGFYTWTDMQGREHITPNDSAHLMGGGGNTVIGGGSKFGGTLGTLGGMI